MEGWVLLCYQISSFILLAVVSWRLASCLFFSYLSHHTSAFRKILIRILEKTWAIRFLKEQWTQSWWPSCFMARISQSSRRSQLGVPGLMSRWRSVCLHVLLYIPYNGYFGGIWGLLPRFRARGGMAWAIGLIWDREFWWCLGGDKSYTSQGRSYPCVCLCASWSALVTRQALASAG